jgi:hypothetical protein
MRRIGLFLLAIVALCSGQVCSSGSSGLAAPDDLGLPIPAGTYSGQFPATARVTLGALPFGQSTDPMPITESFGSDGLPLTADSEPMGVGYAIEESVPGATSTLNVKSIEPAGNSLVITYDATMLFQVSATQVALTGTATRTYRPKVDGTLAVVATLDVSTTMANGAVLSMSVDGSGTLTRQ